MPQTPNAKYHRADHPAMRQMIGPERVAALEHGLAIIDVRLAMTGPGPQREELLGNQNELQTALTRARKVVISREGPIPKAPPSS